MFGFGVQHGAFEIEWSADLRQIVAAVFAGGLNLQVAIVEHPPKKRLAGLHIVDFIQRGINAGFVENAAQMNHAPISQ